MFEKKFGKKSKSWSTNKKVCQTVEKVWKKNNKPVKQSKSWSKIRKGLEASQKVGQEIDKHPVKLKQK